MLLRRYGHSSGGKTDRSHNLNNERFFVAGLTGPKPAAATHATQTSE